jgi:hypothetical protein
MDDQVLIEAFLGRTPFMSILIAEEGARRSLGNGAHNLEKGAEEGDREVVKLIWGLFYNTSRLCCSIPKAKVEKADHFLHMVEFSRGCTDIPIELVQELRGPQQFWSWIKRNLRPFFGATDALLANPDARGFARPAGNPEHQHRFWCEFWVTLVMQRVLVQREAFWEARFTDGLDNMLTLEERLVLPGAAAKAVWATGDATLDKVGAIDWTVRTAAEEPLGPIFGRIVQVVRESYADTSGTELEDSDTVSPSGPAAGPGGLTGGRCRRSGPRR